MSDLAGDAARRARGGPRHRARARGGARVARRALRASCSTRSAGRPTDVRGIGVGVPGPGRVRQRPAGEPADHAGLGRLPDPRVVRRPLRARRCSSTTTSTSWRAASTGRTGARREHLLLIKVGTGIGCGIVADGHIHRGAARRGRRHRPHPRDRPTRTSSAAAATSAASRPSPAARRSPSGSRAGTRTPPAAVTSSGSCRSGHAGAIRMVRDAGRTLGEVLAGTRQLLQPGA